MVGIGIIKQSKAQHDDVAEGAKREMERINPGRCRRHGHQAEFRFVGIRRRAVAEVYKTLAIAIAMVVSVIFLFLAVRATLVPAVTVPVSLIATFLVLLLMLGFPSTS